MDSLMDFLQWVLPTGFLSSLVTWVISRRKQNNDMLSQLQASIDMLSTENRKILDENIKLRSKNAELIINQNEMKAQLTGLTKEIERLRKSLYRKQIKDEKQDKMVAGTTTNHSNHTNGRMRSSETDAQNTEGSKKHQSGIGLTNEPGGHLAVEDSTGDGTAYKNCEGGCGEDTTIGSESGDTDTEPP